MSQWEGSDTPRGRGSGRTIAIVAAILVAGAMIAGAILYVSARDRPRVVTTTSAQEAYEYASADWSCEREGNGGTITPISADGLKIFAEVENTIRFEGTATTNADPDYEVFRRSPIHCTEPGH